MASRSSTIWLLALIILFAATGCGKKDDASSPGGSMTKSAPKDGAVAKNEDGSTDEELSSEESVADTFGNALKDGKWDDALALGSKDFQDSVAVEDLKGGYEEIIDALKAKDATFVVDSVLTNTSDMPTTDDEVKEEFGVDTVPDKSTWKAIVKAYIGKADEDAVSQGVEVSLLIVEENGEDKVGLIDMSPIE